MLYLALMYGVEYLAITSIVFTVVWFLMRSFGQQLKLALVWFILGIILSSHLSGVVRFFLIYYFGYGPVSGVSKDSMWVIFLLVPIVSSVLICLLIRTQGSKVSFNRLKNLTGVKKNNFREKLLWLGVFFLILNFLVLPWKYSSISASSGVEYKKNDAGYSFFISPPLIPDDEVEPLNSYNPDLYMFRGAKLSETSVRVDTERLMIQTFFLVIAFLLYMVFSRKRKEGVQSSASADHHSSK